MKAQKCKACQGTVRPADRLNGPALPGECICWQADGGQPPAAAGKPDSVTAALQVLVLDQRTRAYLRANDPRALQQACQALHDVGRHYLVRDVDVPSDLCWYCLLPLTRTSDGTQVCPDCRHDGQAVQPQQLPAPQYHVVVGNVGTVYSGQDEQDALSTFNAYVEQSKYRTGRAAGEAVTLFADEEIAREYQGTLAADDEGGGQ